MIAQTLKTLCKMKKMQKSAKAQKTYNLNKSVGLLYG